MGFKYTDLVMVRDRANANYLRVPARCRLEGMTVDLTESDIRILCLYEAAIVTAYELLSGPPVPAEELKAIFPEVFQAVGQCVESDVTSYNTVQKA